MTYNDLDNFWDLFTRHSFLEPNYGVKVFRGESQPHFKLIPSIARKYPSENGINAAEDNLLDEFKRLAITELSATPQTDFEWVFLAQHYGLKTRLLDWTTNPLVALFFASEKDDEHNGVVHCIETRFTDRYDYFDYRTADFDKSNTKNTSTTKLLPNQGQFIFLRPKYKDRRYYNQKSIFSCSKNPCIPLDEYESNQILRFEFSAKLKPQIRKRLYALGISTSFIYPGIEGIANEINLRELQGTEFI